jgi:metal-responsive CopG/Arc/MetJ family transcriptional regulator
MMAPIQRVNVDLASGMLEELDRAAKELNISRQAVIKTLIRQALDQQYLARGSQASAKRNKILRQLALLRKLIRDLRLRRIFRIG